MATVTRAARTTVETLAREMVRADAEIQRSILNHDWTEAGEWGTYRETIADARFRLMRGVAINDIDDLIVSDDAA